MAEFAKHSIRFLLMKLYKIEGENCATDMIKQQGSTGFNCIREMKKNTEMELTVQDQIND